MDAFETLKAEILEKRWGVVHFELNKLSDYGDEQLNNLPDSYTAGFGFHGIGPAWQAIDRSDARKILVRILHRGLAYPQEEMPLGDAQALADRILALFSSDAGFFTNGSYAQDEGQGVRRHSITDATFDTGVVFVDRSQIGLFWIEDED